MWLSYWRRKEVERGNLELIGVMMGLMRNIGGVILVGWLEVKVLMKIL